MFSSSVKIMNRQFIAVVWRGGERYDKTLTGTCPSERWAATAFICTSAVLLSGCRYLTYVITYVLYLRVLYNESYNSILLLYYYTLAYAITIHKSQGLSIDCALLDIDSSVFTKGQCSNQSLSLIVVTAILL